MEIIKAFERNKSRSTETGTKSPSPSNVTSDEVDETKSNFVGKRTDIDTN